MNDNYPTGAENDPRAPWNNNDEELWTTHYEQLISAIRTDLAHALPELLWEVIHEHTSGDIAFALYEELYEDVKTVYEKG